MATTTVSKIYSDIDFTFTKKPVTADVALSYDQQAVIRSVRNLLLTRYYERPFNPDLGSNIDALLFEMVSPLTSSALETEIRNTIENYEPRARISDLVVNAMPDNNAYEITLSFYIENATLPTTVTLLLERNR
jgi:phage baseplate assembly protein W